MLFQMLGKKYLLNHNLIINRRLIREKRSVLKMFDILCFKKIYLWNIRFGKALVVLTH